MTLDAEIYGAHFKCIGKRMMLLPDNPTITDIELELVRVALRLSEVVWSRLIVSFRVGVTDVSFALSKKEIP